jgi:hypothetical protein
MRSSSNGAQRSARPTIARSMIALMWAAYPSPDAELRRGGACCWPHARARDIPGPRAGGRCAPASILARQLCRCRTERSRARDRDWRRERRRAPTSPTTSVPPIGPRRFGGIGVTRSSVACVSRRRPRRVVRSDDGGALGRFARRARAVRRWLALPPPVGTSHSWSPGGRRADRRAARSDVRSGRWVDGVPGPIRGR